MTSIKNMTSIKSMCIVCVAFFSLSASAFCETMTGNWSGAYATGDSSFSVLLHLDQDTEPKLAGELKYGEPWGCKLEVYYVEGAAPQKKFSVKYPLVGANGPRCKQLNGVNMSLTMENEKLLLNIETKKGEKQQVTLSRQESAS
ncbi:hypothetical protein [Aliikangiella sp. G2MR2-5]|uniref:hypothetical protein n=1 Tax=Aliikangiella sp. G2MR2-5 TaxID=2788943 RepID=UPI0018A89978|nr:hypothetical protein [Aliikangiella sp. G2MR2-5]